MPPTPGEVRPKLGLTRDFVVPGLVGVLVNLVSFYEAGLNTMPFLHQEVFAPLARLSQAYFAAGPVALILTALLVGLIAARAVLAWASFFVPSFIARFLTGIVLFLRGEANLWPVFLAGDIALGLTALLAVCFSAWLTARIWSTWHS